MSSKTATDFFKSSDPRIPFFAGMKRKLPLVRFHRNKTKPKHDLVASENLIKAYSHRYENLHIEEERKPYDCLLER